MQAQAVTEYALYDVMLCVASLSKTFSLGITLIELSIMQRSVSAKMGCIGLHHPLLF